MMQSQKYIQHFTVAICFVCAAVGHLALGQTATSSGSWNDPLVWDTFVPSDNEPALIPNDFTITKNDRDTTFARIRAGSSPVSGGTLVISSGRINSSNSMVGAHQIALEEFSTGKILVDGGALTTTSSNGGGIQIGVGNNSTGHLLITAGSIETTGGIHLGLGANATGKMTVTGGTVTVATGRGDNMNINTNPNFFVGGLVRSVHERQGVFEQTGGSFTVTDGLGGTHYYFAVGNGRFSQNNPVGTASLTGGSFTANVKIGRDVDIFDAGGSGILTVGPAANVSGQSQAWEVGGNGTLAFQLGSDTSFNAVDLTKVRGPEAIRFTQTGAQIQVNGSAFSSPPSRTPITLMNFQRGAGPSAASRANITVNFVGFDSRLSPRLEWTDSALILRLVR